MSYTLKSPMYEVDLAKHADVSHELRGANGRWTKSLGGGKHLSASASVEHEKWRSPGRSVDEVRTNMDAAIERLQSSEPGTTPHEHAVAALEAHLSDLKRIVETEKSKTEEHRQTVRLKGAGSTFDASLYRVQTSLKPTKESVVKASDFVKEDAAHVRNTELTKVAINLGARAAGAVAGILGAAESEHFVEAFHKLAENPALEAGINVGVALLIGALVSRIQKWMQQRRDRKITQAREAVQR